MQERVGAVAAVAPAAKRVASAMRMEAPRVRGYRNHVKCLLRCDQVLVAALEGLRFINAALFFFLFATVICILSVSTVMGDDCAPRMWFCGLELSL